MQKYRIFQNNERKFYQQIREKYTNWMQEKLNNFRVKYGNQENITKKAEWINKMTKELEEIEEGPKVEIHIDLFKKYQIGKRLAIMENMYSGSRNLLPFTID